MGHGKTTGWAVIKDGSIYINNTHLAIPNLKFNKELGKGANAVVFAAFDNLLKRTVAVKVWNTRGIVRAQSEAAKIAQLIHPLIVSTYQFGTVDAHPYCVMELVDGMSGKVWLSQEPPISQRILVWRLYSTSLRFIHMAGEIHGDPHLGNILVFSDPNDTYGHNSRFGESGLSIKMADAGTSEFWRDHEKILAREAELILETAQRLFKDQNLEKIWSHESGLSHQDTLGALNVLCNYIAHMNQDVDWYAMSRNASILADLLMEAPLFELDEVVAAVRHTGITQSHRLAMRLNEKFQKKYGIEDESGAVGSEMKRLYAITRKEYIDKAKQRPAI